VRRNRKVFCNDVPEAFHFCNIFDLVKKLTAILFLLIFLFAITEMRELLNLPVLIHHYLEHHDDDAGISFVQFLHKHYSEEHEHASHDKEHEKLPFKSHDIGFSQTTLAYQPFTGFEFKTGKPVSNKINSIYRPAFHPTSILSRIWQPPRYC